MDNLRGELSEARQMKRKRERDLQAVKDQVATKTKELEQHKKKKGCADRSEVIGLCPR